MLERTTRRMSLTEAGAAYYERCQRIVAELEDAEAAVSQLLQAPRGVLRVSSPVAFTQHVLAPLLPRFMREHPAVRIRLTADNAQRTPVASGHDLALRVGRHEDNELVSRPLCRASLRLYASAGYVDKCGEPTDPADLLQHRLLVHAAGATG